MAGEPGRKSLDLAHQEIQLGKEKEGKDNIKQGMRCGMIVSVRYVLLKIKIINEIRAIKYIEAKMST